VIPSLVFYFLQATISWNGRPFAHRDWRTKSRSQETCRSPRDAARRSRSLQGQIASINDQFEAFKAVAKHHDNSLETQKTTWELEWKKAPENQQNRPRTWRERRQTQRWKKPWRPFRRPSHALQPNGPSISNWERKRRNM
jgi:hypothetical protein